MIQRTFEFDDLMSHALSIDLPGPGRERQAKLTALLFSPQEVVNRSRQVYEAMLEQSEQIRTGNFTVIGSDDLERMFGLYDREFFRGLLGEMLMEDRAHPMAFRLSRRLTRAAGQTMRQVRRSGRGRRIVERVEYEISVSTTLLFSTFQNVEREVIVGGLTAGTGSRPCSGSSSTSCSTWPSSWAGDDRAARPTNFHALSRRIFAHEGVSHDLVTPREQAARGLRRPGRRSRALRARRRAHRGRVNRITRRATVLVEHPRGEPFSDGRRYLSFYVPLPLLHKDA